MNADPLESEIALPIYRRKLNAPLPRWRLRPRVGAARPEPCEVMLLGCAAPARTSLAANNRRPRSSRFEPSASHRCRIACVSIMPTKVAVRATQRNPSAPSHSASWPRHQMRFTYRCGRPKCKCCLKLFRPDPRNRRHQCYCSARACRAASKTASQARWLAKPENQSYFRGAVNVARVRAWRSRHAGYWRKGRRACPALQDVSMARPIGPPIETANAAGSPLQDVLTAQPAVLIGLIAHLVGTLITTNRAYKHWSQIFNNDSTLTSAILDRVLHHADTVIIEGKSFRMKDEIEE